MPTKIKSDYQPSQRVYELLKAYGIQNPIEFVGHELPAFLMYWEDSGKAKVSWDTTCLNWMKRTYEDKKHQMAQHRPFGKERPDVFSKVLDDLFDKPIEQIEEIQRNLKVDLSVYEPKPGPAISQEEAFAQLRGILK